MSGEVVEEYVKLRKERRRLLEEFVKVIIEEKDLERAKAIKMEIKEVDERIKELRTRLLKTRKERMRKFLEEYERLCMKYLVFIDAKCKECVDDYGMYCEVYQYIEDVMDFANISDPYEIIKMHIETLRKSLEGEE